MMELRTDRYKLKEIFPEKAKLYAQKLKIKAGELEFVRKGIPIDPKDIEIKEGERAAIRLVTTPHLDRDGEILIPGGAILDDFRQSPTVMYAHDYKSLPIGSDQWIKVVKEGILAKTVYAKHQFAEDVYQCVKDRHLNSNSVGFIPVEAVTPEDKKLFGEAQGILEKDYGILKDESARAKSIYTKYIVLEHSDVPIASNAQSLNLAVSKGELVIQSERLKKDLEIEVVKDREIEMVKDDDKIGLVLKKSDISVINQALTEGFRIIENTKAEAEALGVIITKPETTELKEKICDCPNLTPEEIEREYGKMELIDYGYVQKPYANEHACRMRDPDDFDPDTFRRISRDNEEFPDGSGKIYPISLILAKLKGASGADDSMVLQAFRYPKKKWDADTAKAHCKHNKGQSFEVASENREIKKDKEIEIETTNDGQPKKVAAISGVAIQYPDLENAIKELTGQIVEFKEGRVLSVKNRMLVKETISALTTLKEKLEELHNAAEPPAKEESKEPKERELILEKKGKQDGLDERITDAIEKLFEGDKIGKMMDDAIKDVLDIGIKKKLGKVE